MPIYFIYTQNKQSTMGKPEGCSVFWEDLPQEAQDALSDAAIELHKAADYIERTKPGRKKGRNLLGATKIRNIATQLADEFGFEVTKS